MNEKFKLRKKVLELHKKKKPSFKRQDWYKVKKLKKKWKKPRGRHSKLREYRKYRWKKPSIGYGTPLLIKGLHPSGYEEMLVSNSKDLESMDKELQAIRFSSGLGKRKKQELLKKASEMGVKVLNP